MCISSQRDAHMHVTECLEHIRQFIKWFIKWFAKSCAFVVLVLKISSSGRKWFKIGIVQSLGVVYFWKGICVPSTAGDCDLVGDTVTCRELCMQSVLLAATSLPSDRFSSVPDRALCGTLFTTTSFFLGHGPCLGLWLVGIVCYTLCIQAVEKGVCSWAPPGTCLVFRNCPFCLFPVLWQI